MQTITNQDEIIDSRDIIARIEELESLDSPLDPDDSEELAALKALAEEASADAEDWEYGATLIRHDYFQTYIEELISECYPEVEKVAKSSDWPMRHMKLAYEAAAEEALDDYTEFNYGGVIYYAR